MSDDDVRWLYGELIAGWNDRSGAAMAATFADDGVAIGYDGSVHAGRRTIAKEIGQIFDEHETGRYVVKVQNVRELGSDAALLLAIAGLVPPGQAQIKPEVNAHQTLVAECRDGRWQVVLFQNTPAQFHGRPHLVEEMTRELQAVADS